MSKKIFIFDLDGVIVDTAKFHFVAWQALAAGIGIDFTEKENEQLKGVSRVESLKKILQWGDKQLSEADFKAKMEEKNTVYLSHIETLTTDDILPGVLPFLQQLKEAGQPIALGSASKNARPILQKLGIFDYFDIIVDGTNVTKAKPDPEVFVKACEALDYSPKEAIVFEDSVAGVQAANAAGMYAIGIGEQAVLAEAKEVFTGFDEMPTDYMQQLLNN